MVVKHRVRKWRVRVATRLLFESFSPQSAFSIKEARMRGANERPPRRSENYVAGEREVSNKAGGLLLRKCWGEKDSNLRRQSRQLYSLLHLTALVSPLKSNLSWRSDSNGRPAVYKTAALPTELLQRKAFGKKSIRSLAVSESSPVFFTARSPALP